MIRSNYEIDGVLSLLIPSPEVVFIRSTHDIHTQHVYCIRLVATAFLRSFVGVLAVLNGAPGIMEASWPVRIRVRQEEIEKMDEGNEGSTAERDRCRGRNKTQLAWLAGAQIGGHFKGICRMKICDF